MDQHKPMSLTKTALRSGLAAFAVTLVALGGAELSWSEGQAQTIAAHNSRAPVSFDAGRIELQDRENRVALSGQVVVRQADLTVQSDRMLVNYTDADSLDVQRITASGGVTATVYEPDSSSTFVTRRVTVCELASLDTVIDGRLKLRAS